jgi:hypothetical protein
MVMNAIRLAGITPTGSGLRIAPHLPFARFSLRLPAVGVAAGPRRLRGYLRPQQGGRVVLRVALPSATAARRATAFAGGRRVRHARDGRWLRFATATRRGRAADWAVSW